MRMNLTGKRCLVLGGTGFIGTNLCRALVSSGANVRSFARKLPKRYKGSGWQAHVEWTAGDLSSAEQVRISLRNIDIVFHLISSTLPASSNLDVLSDLSSNVVPTLQMLDLARKIGIEKIVFISSGGAIYGIPKRVPIVEDDQTNPICAYGIHKLAIEKYLQLFHHQWKLEYGILRVSNPYGVGQPVDRPQGVIATFVHRTVNREALEVWGDGTAIRDYIHIDDVIDAFLMLSRYQGSARVFNIGSGKGHTLLELIATIESITGRSVDVHFRGARSVDVPINILDISRAKSELTWCPKRVLEMGIRQMLEHSAPCQRPSDVVQAAIRPAIAI